MNTKTRIHPRAGQTYSLRQIAETLYLRDSPSLGFTHEGRDGVIQDSHLTEEEMLTVPGFADSQWRFVRETHEWIPIFRYAGSQPITDFIEIEQAVDYWTGRKEDAWWAVPKGFPRPQEVSEEAKENLAHAERYEAEQQAEYDALNDEQKRQMSVVRNWSPGISVKDGLQAYATYRSYRDEGQTEMVSRQYAGLL